MNALTYVFLPALAGVGMGTLYFGGLWLTLRRMVSTSRPAFFILGSYLGRLAVCFIGFMAIARIGEWQGLLVCLGCFIAVRVIIVRRLGKPALAIDARREKH